MIEIGRAALRTWGGAVLRGDARGASKACMFNPYFHVNQIFIDPDSRTVVAMTPKVMTTFIRAAFRDGYREFHGREHASEGRYRFVVVADRFPMPRPRAYLDVLARPGRYQAFGFVRNPYWRLYSAWRNKLYDPWRKIEAGTLRRYPPSVRATDLPRLRRFAAARGLDGAEDGALAPFGTFAAFVAANSNFRRNKHWRGQARMLQVDHFRNMRILPVEDGVADGMTEIFLRLGFDRSWIGERLRQPENASSVFSGTPYDENLAALTYGAFREDFARFGYDRDSWRKVQGAPSPGREAALV